MTVLQFWQSKPGESNEDSQLSLNSPLSQSREIGDALPDPPERNVSLVIAAEKPAVKPWAHFLGGA